MSLVSLHGGHQAGPSLSSLASLTVDGKVVGLRVYGTDASQRHVVALTRAGSLCCLRLSLPEGGAESLHGMQVRGGRSCGGGGARCSPKRALGYEEVPDGVPWSP